MPLILALLPIVVVLALLILRRTAADLAGLIGWLSPPSAQTAVMVLFWA